MTTASATSPSFSPPAPAPPPLTLFQKDSENSYKVIRKLGEGSYSTVLEVFTPRGQHQLAMKVHHVGKYFFDTSQREADNLKLLQDCPHMVQYRGDFRLNPPPEFPYRNQHAILMEKSPPNLRDYWRNPGFSVDQILSIARQCLETLQYLKSKEFIHTDLKPQNLFFDPESNKLTVGDVGSIEMNKDMNPNRQIQTRWYRAPECLFPTSYDASIDMWSLGVILFELYTTTIMFLSEGDDESKTGVADHAHLLDINMKQSIASSLQIQPPSEKATKIIRLFDEIGKKYPNLPIWEARMHDAAAKRRAKPLEAQKLITLIAPMLNFDPKERIKPEDALQLLSELSQPPAAAAAQSIHEEDQSQ